tara:strand:+ start:398 stop:805 length:408 start_codon:yes stop_codon:yes gene_type:complete
MAYYNKSKSDKWQTPVEFYKKLNDEFKFNYDPCPIDWKPTDDNALVTEWGTRNFVNPPYSNAKHWIKKCSIEHQKGKLIVLLINSITDTIAFHEYIYKKPNIEIRFIKGRLKFINPQTPTISKPNVKPSMLVIFR